MDEDLSQLSAQEIENRILDFIRRELLGSEVTIGREDDLLSGELLDSMGVLRLTTFIEEEFQIEMQPSGFVVENFQNAKVLAEFVQQAARSADPGRAT